MPHETIVDSKNDDELITAGMLADRLRPLVLASCNQGKTGTSCLSGGPFIPLHRATVGAIYSHLERIAERDGESTIRSLEMQIEGTRLKLAERATDLDEKLEARRKLAAAAIEAFPHD